MNIVQFEIRTDGKLVARIFTVFLGWANRVYSAGTKVSDVAKSIEDFPPVVSSTDENGQYLETLNGDWSNGFYPGV